jgi:cholesterol oxidase
MENSYEAIVIGTGFGGAITGCRLAKKWPGGRVLILERGKRYPIGSFARAPHDLAQAFWMLSDEKTLRPRRIRKAVKRIGDESHGIFDVRNYKHMDVVIGAGLGGGSLIYANVFMVPPEEIFDDRWPASCKRSMLQPYYEIAKAVLGSRPIPAASADPRREILRTKLFQEIADKNGRKSELVDLNVFFGNDFQNPTPIGHQETNRYGALQTSCFYCSECVIGCNYHAKNTLDLNYLHVAEHRYEAVIRTEHLVTKIVPLGANGQDDPEASGKFGYRIYFRDLCAREPGMQAAIAKRVIVSAGTLGSTELLLRCKEQFRTLPRISDRLGQSFSGNGDFLSFVLDSKQAASPNYGPVITQRTDFNLFEKFDAKHAFILEDAGYASIVAWFADGARPGLLDIQTFLNFLRDWITRWTSGKSLGKLGWIFGDLLGDDVSFHTCVQLCMGLDKSNGVMSLNGNHQLAIDWPYEENMPLYRAILDAGKNFARAVGSNLFVPLPTWNWPIRNNVTVHALGGCVLANDPEHGVTNADPKKFGEVFGYEGLYVADGAIVPTAVGANPTATISALSEMAAEGITGISPDANL